MLDEFSLLIVAAIREAMKVLCPFLDRTKDVWASGAPKFWTYDFDADFWENELLWFFSMSFHLHVIFSIEVFDILRKRVDNY
jgi:hypothetical protein